MRILGFGVPELMVVCVIFIVIRTLIFIVRGK